MKNYPLEQIISKKYFCHDYNHASDFNYNLLVFMGNLIILISYKKNL